MGRTATNPDPEKQLMIKARACQRLAKEATYYKTEVQENEAKLGTMRAERRDPYDIKKFEEVLSESRMMVPDSEARLVKNLNELSAYLDANADGIDPDGEWAKAAKKLLVENGLARKGGEAGAAKAKAEAATADDVQETNVEDLKEGEAF